MTAIEDIWSADKLGRREDAEFLSAFILGRYAERSKAGIRGAYVLNVNAEWGFGKTFFMRRFADQLSEQHPVVFIDAWKNDFSDDPYTTVISEIDAFFKKHIPSEDNGEPSKAKKALTAVKRNAGKIMLAAAKGAGKQLLKRAIGGAVDEIGDMVSEHVKAEGPVEKALEKAGHTGLEAAEGQLIKISGEILDAFATEKIAEYQAVKESLDQFKASVASLLTEFDKISPLKLPMFVFVDELDRCRPPYAIAMLERIKHLFDVDDIVFVISTDTKQLAHSINGVYGATFDSPRYLQRFFSRTFTLPNPSKAQFIEASIQATGVDTGKWHSIGVKDDKVAFLADASHHFGMGLRDIEQAMDILTSLTTVWNEKFPIELSIMYPLIFGYLVGANIADWSDTSWFYEKMRGMQDWILDEQGSDGYGRPFRQRNSGTNYIYTLLAAVRQDMRKFLDAKERNFESRSSDPERLPDLFAQQVISREYNARFSNYVREGEYSYIKRYPELIKHAGQLSR